MKVTRNKAARSLTSAARWLTRHGTALIVSAFAFCAGMVVMLPLGVSLPDPAASLIGSMLGAMLAVGGSVVLWRGQEIERVEAVLAGFLSPVTVYLRETYEVARAEKAPGGTPDALVELLEKALQNLERADDASILLDVEVRYDLIRLATVLSTAKEKLSSLAVDDSLARMRDYIWPEDYNANLRIACKRSLRDAIPLAQNLLPSLRDSLSRLEIN